MWILLSIAIAIVLLFVIMLIVNRKIKRPVDYYNFFIIGFIWLVIGFPLDNPVLSIIGLVFMIIGLVNRKKWKANRRTWKGLSKKEKRVRIWIMIILLILIILGFVMMFLG